MTAAATIDYLTTLPWYAVSDPAETTPIHDQLAAEVAAATPCRCGSVGTEPCVTKSGRVLAVAHKGRQ